MTLSCIYLSFITTVPPGVAYMKINDVCMQFGTNRMLGIFVVVVVINSILHQSYLTIYCRDSKLSYTREHCGPLYTSIGKSRGIQYH